MWSCVVRGTRRNLWPILLGLVVVCRVKEVSGTQVALEGNGYKFVLALSPDLGQGSCTSYTTNIELLLNATSLLLYSVTGRKLFFQQVTVVLPRGWECTGLDIGVQKEGETWENAALRMGPRHPIFGDTPWTQQTQGCGRQGDFVYLSEEFVQYLSDVLGSQEHVLLHEWAKYRWGVFEEYGHLYDPVYPPSIRSQFETLDEIPRLYPLSLLKETVTAWLPNYCTDRPLVAQPNQFGSPDECVQEENCVFLIDDKENEYINSSLMSVPFLTGVSTFCDDSTHVRDLPNKHNAFCNGKSVWSVINQHPDMSVEPQKNEAPDDLKVLYVQERESSRSLSDDDETDKTSTSAPSEAPEEDVPSVTRRPLETPKEGEPTVSTTLAPVTVDLQVWASHDLTSITYDLDHPVVLFATVSDPDSLIVLDASVSAEVQWGSAHKMVLQLKDDGLAADVTGNDGVYSAFVLGPVGATKITVSATNEQERAKVVVALNQRSVPITYDISPVCCGSRVVVTNTRALQASFSASVSLPKVVFENDLLAETLPGRVVDLVAKGEDLNVVLSFTMTGKHLDIGLAKTIKVMFWKYGYKGLPDEETFFNNEPSGSRKNISMTPRTCNDLYVFTVLGITDTGLEGPQSNRALASISCNWNPSPDEPTEQTPSEYLGAGAIVGIVFGVIFLILLIGLGNYLIIRFFFPHHLYIFRPLGCHRDVAYP
ncbi:uncharacterized protein LOC143032832 [Oratosquilla oratoria]|uniref:uncharacterized protein LOC143032832 n=1 Tax=Oratosquilla oratoria TaxID=337810 RepID=UPI003F75C07A